MSTAQRAPQVGAVMLDDALLREVRRVLSDAGITGYAAFVLVELNEGGLRTAVVDAATGASLVERGDGKLCPRMLDLAMADHLVRVGRVERPTSFEWATELIELMPGVRSRLAVTDGAFAMGRDHVSMVRVSRRDFYAGLQPHLMAAQSLWQATALNAPLPVGAIVFMPEHEQWPGLYPTLSHLAPIPAVALRDPGTESRAIGGSVENGSEPTRGDVVQTVAATLQGPPGLPRTEVVTALDTATPVTPAAPVSTPVPLDGTPPDVPSVAPTVHVPVEVLPAPGAGGSHAVEQGGVRLPTGTYLPDPLAPPVFRGTGEQDVYVPVDVVEPASAPDHGLVKRSAGPRHYTPPSGAWSTSSAGRSGVPAGRSALPAGRSQTSSGGEMPLGTGRPRRNRRVLMGVGAIAGVAVTGAAIVVGVGMLGDSGSDGGSDSGSAMVAQTSSVPAPGATTTAPTGARPPLDTRAARAPMLRYTPPPTVDSPPTAAAAAPSRTAPPRRRPAAPQRRSIPNPIPGLPPILLP